MHEVLDIGPSSRLKGSNLGNDFIEKHPFTNPGGGFGILLCLEELLHRSRRDSQCIGKLCSKGSAVLDVPTVPNVVELLMPLHLLHKKIRRHGRVGFSLQINTR